MNNTLEWYQLVGIAGTCIYLGCYFLTQLGKLSTPGFTYSALNIIAASCVGVSLIYDFNLASAMIQVSWIVISFVGVVLLLSQNFHRQNFNRRNLHKRNVQRRNFQRRYVQRRSLRKRYSGESTRPYELQRAIRVRHF